MRASRENGAERRCQPNRLNNASRCPDFLDQRAAVQDQAPLASYPKRSKRNPLRGHLDALSVAIEANKLDHYIDDDALEWIRKGEAAARILADDSRALPCGYRRARWPENSTIRRLTR